MSVYLIPLQSALLLFPFLAAMITLPYIIMQYRKYGSILPIRVLIVYSFIFYLLCAYFLVVLPLPPIEEVASYTKPIMQLIPFASLKEFTMNSSLIWNDPATYLTALNEPSLYLIVFNILLTVPFGVYLRYYFQCSWKKTLLLTFLLTLSFECLQLSALFGYYPRPYRLFDVDDLITNTLGGMLGYAITPVFAHFLVSRSRMDEKAYDRGRSVSPLRRVLAFFFDNLIVLLTTAIITALILFLHDEFLLISPANRICLIYLAVVFVYLFILPILMHGKTLGKAAVKIKLVTMDGHTPHWYQYLLHFMILYGLILPAPFYIFHCVLAFLTQSATAHWMYGVAVLILAFLYIVTMYQCILSLFDKDAIPWYDRFLPIKNQSSIQGLEKEAPASDATSPTEEDMSTSTS
ncbi:VanZ family protein [[Clostridium] innocuum]|nr:VanZ family protein [Erysipelotrichaceae bacterium]MCR0384342.1 VanZ family protein [[Clostridium] innocuum]MCR0412191.1 VanZ family protein [[Clostridium] innocuum]MCR0535535.1 VanZ family protein [[Clostridium] innocuum]MCR0539179.1 VanZ family protein [[Clostridium] innocuum]